jgi:hypothetical protein
LASKRIKLGVARRWRGSTTASESSRMPGPEPVTGASTAIP